MKNLVWHNCYDESWGPLLVPAAFGHPAKFNCALIRRIIEHCLEHKWLKKGDLVGDPFGGVACGGIIAASYGLRWIGLELEPAFVKLGNENIELHRRTWEQMGDHVPVLIQGDSRQFASIIAGQVSACITSPPYAEAHVVNIDTPRIGDTPGKPVWKQTSGDYYGRSTPGQIGAMKAGELSAVLTSPPYAETEMGAKGEGPGAAGAPHGGKHQACGKASGVGYGTSFGQIGAMKAGHLAAIVSSPPWENQEPSHAQGSDFASKKVCRGRAFIESTYGQTAGQVGKESQATYWGSVARVYSECYKALRPGGVMCLVVKAFVKKGKIVDLPGQTLELLEHIGFEPLERIKAMLVKERRHKTLFGGEQVKRTERKSFFRRLHEKKHPETAIDAEEVLVCRKPA